MIEEGYLRAALWWRSRPLRVTARLARRRHRLPPRMPQVDVIRTAAVQMRAFVAKSPADYADRAYELVRLAAQRGAELVAFPENSALPLLALMPGLPEMVAEHGGLEGAVAALSGEGDTYVQVVDLLTVVTPAVRRVFVTVFSSLARMFRVHLMAGSAMLADREGRVHNVAHLFGPDGRLIGTQAKCHLLPLERDWGLSTGHQFRVLDTATGRLAMPVWMDAAYFETFDILRRLGAEIALVGAANPEPYHPYRALRGLWPRVQESQMYGVQSALVGEAFGLTLSGPTAIYAPLDLSPGRDGVLAQAETVDRDEVVTADLDMAALRRLRQEDPQPKNMALIRYYLPDLYTRPWPWLEGVMPNG